MKFPCPVLFQPLEAHHAPGGGLRSRRSEGRGRTDRPTGGAAPQHPAVPGGQVHNRSSSQGLRHLQVDSGQMFHRYFLG